LLLYTTNSGKLNKPKTNGTADFCAREQIAKQHAVKGVAVAVGLKTSDYVTNMP
jgi:hypothetical protein